MLRENATYIINFGQTVKDLTEGNVVKDLRFVFSTGDYIDSLEVKGSIVDALEGKPVENVLLMLYDNLADSIVYTEKPFYFSRSDKSGKLEIKNIRADTFKVVALEDANLNYLFDPANEQIGFLDSFIVLNDSIVPNIEIRLFRPQQPIQVSETALKTYGRASLIFNQLPEDVVVTHQDVGQRVYYENIQDTVRLWYDMDTVQSWSIYVQKDTLLRDTIRIRALDRGRYRKAQTVRVVSDGKKTDAPTAIDVHKGISLTFNHPILAFDTSRIFLLEDSSQNLVLPSISIARTNQRRLRLLYGRKPDTQYQVQLLPGAITDWFELQNDSLLLDFKSLLFKDYGNIRINLTDMDTAMAYVLELRSKDGLLIAREKIQGDSVFQKNYPQLYKGNYGIKLIEDRNANGRWDTGDYDSRTQPERQAEKALDELRGNWEVNSETSVRQLLDEKPKLENSNGPPNQ